MKRFFLGLICLAVIVAIFGTTGCETVKGTGRDVEGLGESMQGE